MGGLSGSQALANAGTINITGWAQGVIVPAPAAAVPTIGRIAPGETWERVLCGRCTLTADATVGNRSALIQVVDVLGNVWWEAPATGVVVASTSVEVSFAVGVPQTLAAAGISVAVLPDFLLQSGFGVRLSATMIGAADTWGPLNMYVQRFPSDAVHIGPAG